MPEEGRLLLVNHTATEDAVGEQEMLAAKAGMQEITKIHFSAIDTTIGDFSAVMLLGLSKREKAGLELVRRLKARWPKAVLYVVTHHKRRRVLDACRANGASEAFHSNEVGEAVSPIKKLPDS